MTEKNGLQELAMQEKLDIDQIGSLISGEPALIPLTVDEEYAKVFKPNWRHLMDQCVNALIQAKKGDKVQLILPVAVLKPTKLNKIRLVVGDRNSPLGVVVRGDVLADLAYGRFVSARFNCIELAQFCARQTS